MFIPIGLSFAALSSSTNSNTLFLLPKLYFSLLIHILRCMQSDFISLAIFFISLAKLCQTIRFFHGSPLYHWSTPLELLCSYFRQESRNCRLNNETCRIFLPWDIFITFLPSRISIAFVFNEKLYSAFAIRRSCSGTRILSLIHDVAELKTFPVFLSLTFWLQISRNNYSFLLFLPDVSGNRSSVICTKLHI